jgi:pseudouridine kinase
MKYTDQKSGYVIILGGVNVDIQGFPNERLIPEDSNIGRVKISMGGVGRNIGENLIRLGVNTKLISVVGDDIYSKKKF